MTDTRIMLEQAISDYLLWMISKGYADKTCIHYEQVLKHFLLFVSQKPIGWDAVFTFETIKQFQKETGLTHAWTAPRGLCRYLFEHDQIKRPIERPVEKIPEIYEQYLAYYAKTRQVQHCQMLRTRNTLAAFNAYLKSKKIKPAGIKIEQIDAFLAKRNAKFTPVVRQNQRSNLRGFLRYLYQQRKILHKDLSSLVVGAPLFAQAIPPKFLRPQEIQRLFAGIDLCSQKGIRTNAMLYLAYTLGLRPKEISLVTLDDMFFGKREISLRDRKSKNPIKLPLPDDTIKAIAAYIVGARPKSSERALFLTFRAPYKPISPVVVSQDIGTCMRKANIAASAYWLRHTYAQNLLEQEASIFEIKEMLGHDRIQTTQRYIYINIKLMREVLFDETL
jgi:integrase/recombinase XerD